MTRHLLLRDLTQQQIGSNDTKCQKINKIEDASLFLELEKITNQSRSRGEQLMDLSNLANPPNLGMDLISRKRPTAALLILHPLCIHTPLLYPLPPQIQIQIGYKHRNRYKYNYGFKYRYKYRHFKKSNQCQLKSYKRLPWGAHKINLTQKRAVKDFQKASTRYSARFHFLENLFVA